MRNLQRLGRFQATVQAGLMIVAAGGIVAGERSTAFAAGTIEAAGNRPAEILSGDPVEEGLPAEAYAAKLRTDPNNVSIRVLYAKALFDAKEYGSAVEQYTFLLAATPGDYTYQLDRGLAEARNSDHAKAIADFLACTKTKPTEIGAWNNLGAEYGELSDWPNAIAAYTRVIALKPDEMEAYKNRGIYEYNQQQAKPAIADLTAYNAAKPGDAQVGRLLATLLAGSSDPDAAITAATSQVKAHPDDGISWANLGTLYYSLKKYAPAADAFSHAIAIKEEPTLLYNRGLAYYFLGTTDPIASPKAETDAVAALKLKPDYVEAELLKADAEYAEKKFKIAETDFMAYAQRNTVSTENKDYALKQAMHAALDGKDYAGVISMTTVSIASKPSEASNYKLRGDAYLESKAYDLAIPDLLKFTTMRPDDAAGFNNLGKAYEGNGDADKAKEAFAKARALKK